MGKEGETAGEVYTMPLPHGPGIYATDGVEGLWELEAESDFRKQYSPVITWTHGGCDSLHKTQQALVKHNPSMEVGR